MLHIEANITPAFEKDPERKTTVFNVNVWLPG